MGNLDNADQRIAEDLQQFCATAADLFSRTFKPALDVVLSTRRMATRMGYSGLSVLYSYFLFSGAVVRSVSPQFPKIIAEQAALEGEFRSAHARVIAHAEEIAFLEGAEREEVLLNRRLEETTAAASRYFFLQYRQGCVDQFFLKYFASCVGWPVLAVRAPPPHFSGPPTRPPEVTLRHGGETSALMRTALSPAQVPFLMHPGDDPGELSARYREFDSLMQGSCAAIGDLMMARPPARPARPPFPPPQQTKPPAHGPKRCRRQRAPPPPARPLRRRCTRSCSGSPGTRRGWWSSWRLWTRTAPARRRSRGGRWRCTTARASSSRA